MIKIVYSSNIAISCCHSMTAAYYVFTIIFIIIIIVSILEEEDRRRRWECVVTRRAIDREICTDLIQVETRVNEW